MLRRGFLLSLLGLSLLSCGTPDPAAAPRPVPTTVADRAPTTTAAPGTATSTAATTAVTSTASTTARPARPPVVVLDAGHNGGNAGAPGAINRQVPAGRGRTKACNTTGTATEAGYAEHAFNFDVARRIGRLLAARDVRVVRTRDRDDGVGPCVDRRAAIGNEAGADAVVSIHADGATAADARGFHIAYSAPPLNAAQGEPSLRLARALRGAFTGAGFPASNYLGDDGLAPRDDLAGLNLSERPAVLVECGNMRDPREAAAMSSPAGRQRYAEAIATGILAYLARE
ncbi:N-acetylmuramoyl-L-alanine amidase [Prauserella shujinwangii]|uniref:N-acetylmuramoyl-L-alanine amidase n=1 Tax=Prauserella shujinwangii TaxID=1453103 RepID=A0A2T0LNG4_9PSEU|nr:N-acetylmuramoyl-L-alanine amidase [Prauserella shujinwangii]PRX44732.1 N-acetylmuramoyl-L-alanine amidase [Prauserella shujinwangii]